ncbi:MAG: hypothetical protein J5744_02620 [Oscillospiraceae bacterium]|nr:hypothetical protein [Oscillospiraceae bacterium]
MKSMSGLRLMAGLLAALLILYISMQVYLVSFPSYRTEVAVLYELSDEITASGTVVRNEYVSDDSGGVKYYLVSDGDKVAKGENVAEYYRDAGTAVRSLYRQQLEKELDILTDLSKGNRGNTNLQSIRKSVYGVLSEYSSEIGRQDYSGIDSVRRSLISYLSSYEISAGGRVDTSVRAEEVRTEISAAEAYDLEPTGYVTADESGFFVSFTDGCESILTPDMLGSLAPEQIKELIEEAHGSYKYSGDSYKILSDYNWYYVCTMTQEEASRLRTGRMYSADFSFSSSTDVPAKVETILPSQDGTYSVVVLSFDRMNPAASVLRNEDIQIKFTNYRGIRVDKTALRLIDGNLGVFIKYGSLVKFRKVDIIYETDDFILSSATEGSGSILSLYDEIIVQGKNLYVDRDLSRS